MSNLTVFSKSQINDLKQQILFLKEQYFSVIDKNLSLDYIYDAFNHDNYNEKFYIKMRTLKNNQFLDKISILMGYKSFSELSNNYSYGTSEDKVSLTSHIFVFNRFDDFELFSLLNKTPVFNNYIDNVCFMYEINKYTEELVNIDVMIQEPIYYLSTGNVIISPKFKTIDGLELFCKQNFEMYRKYAKNLSNVQSNNMFFNKSSFGELHFDDYKVMFQELYLNIKDFVYKIYENELNSNAQFLWHPDLPYLKDAIEGVEVFYTQNDKLEFDNYNEMKEQFLNISRQTNPLHAMSSFANSIILKNDERLEEFQKLYDYESITKKRRKILVSIILLEQYEEWIN